jgi:exosortase/archaeosortase family protein
LVATAVLLAASRYAVGTAPMNAYLYYVAKHTSAVLGWVSYDSQLEEAGTRSSNAAGIRTTLEAWRNGEPAPPNVFAVQEEGAAPLTPWESWHYRIGQTRRELEQKTGAIAKLETITIPGGDTVDERMAAIERALDTLEASTKREAGHGVMREAYQTYDTDVEAIRRTLLEGPGQQQRSFTAGLAELEADVLRVREKQLDFLTTRRTQVETRMQKETGPLVSVVHKAGLRRKLDDARKEMASAELVNGETNPALREKVQALQTQRAEAPPETLAQLDRDVQFRFSVVADCGALPSMSIFVAAMIAFPAAWRKKLIGIALGIPALYVVNILRLVCLGIIGAYTDGGPEFDFAHHYVWQGIYIVFVVAIWMLWVEVLVKPGRVARAAAAS